jgi:hypothetical protein
MTEHATAENVMNAQTASPGSEPTRHRIVRGAREATYLKCAPLGAPLATTLLAWLLMTPPVPLGTELPPMSKWSRLSSHEKAEECERDREAVRAFARRTVAADPNASALKVAGALGRLQSRCVEVRTTAKPAPPAAAEAPAKNAQPASEPAPAAEP